ncbi:MULTISPECIES: terminase large subunit [Rhizobium]|uniref:Terminase large subunit n=1 Tax=Rhizobium favelukesii TaxID=348824 RepID=W6RG00_9HYPH|nr:MULTISPECIES: terminase TerL endonuclease subunit [Rhizobium]MCS0460334.1 terminase large subunit [Rhizobium favelukesii]UFS80861.1 terminase large subunit [Rhizobium sp. T136]CDM57618.1 putative terminase large subunit [Rhizobium favelukesii]
MASTYPSWIFDGSPIDDPFGYGERAVNFLRLLRHPNSTALSHFFQLYDWQERIVRRIYGPRHPDGRRIVETVFWMIPRGNRKTSLAAALALLHTIGPERVPAGQVIFAASDREQAGLGFKEAANIVRMDKRLVAATRIYDAHNSAKKIVLKSEGVELQAISSDGAAQHGKTPAFVLVDEIHVWKGRDLWEALKSGMVKTSGTLMVIATTAGRGSENLGFTEYDYARKVARGEIENPAYLPIIFEAAPGDDWQDEIVWHRVNPGLAHGFPNLNALRTAAKEAADRPAERFAFQQFNLNIWQAASRDPLFDMGVYDAGLDPHFDLADLSGLPCFLGVDMSVNGDLTAVVGAWRHNDRRVTVHPWFFVPGEDLKGRSQRDGVPYEQWRDEGLITVIDGPVIEPEVVEAHIREICADNGDVREIAFDPHLARMTMQRLHDDGLPAVEMRQGPLTMGPAIGHLERTVNGRMIRHNGHPILRHHFDSVVASRNDTGLVRMHKGKKTDRIDGAVAAAMAVSRAVANDNQRSIFDLDPDEFDRLRAEAA